MTPDILKELGYTHILDWPADDQPFWMKTRSGPILSVPYPLELNDAGALAMRDQTGREFADMLVDQFEQMIEECLERPLVLSLSLHGFIVGQPFRFRPLRIALKHCVEHKYAAERVRFTRAKDIAAHCSAWRPAFYRVVNSARGVRPWNQRPEHIIVSPQRPKRCIGVFLTRR